MNFVRPYGLPPGLTPQKIKEKVCSFRGYYTETLKVAIVIQLASIAVLLILTSSIASDVEANAGKPISQANFVEPIPVNVRSSSQNTEIDLRFGYSKRGVNCQFFSETIALVLQKELNLNTTLIPFETENELFDALTERKIDLTLCFLDPIDRVELIKPERLGHITQIGTHYWADEHKKLQIWANAATKTHLRNDMPCVYHFFEKIKFTEIPLNEVNDALSYQNKALEWYQNHTNQVREWLKCTS